jgi:alpha-L-rhamnosidase
VEVTGYPRGLTKADVTGLVIGTAAPVTGRFHTSDPRLNRLHSNITWSQRANFLSIPTDCPQRSERVGWTGDINMFVPTAAFNMDIRRFLGDKWMTDLRDNQGGNGTFNEVVPDYGSATESDRTYSDIVWTSAAVHVPYAVWQTYGDAGVIEENWATLTRFMDHWESTLPTTIYGDWAPPGAVPTNATLHPLVPYAWLKHDADMMAAMAAATGRTAAARHYEQLAADTTARFNTAFVLPDGTVQSAGVPTQTGYALALAFDLLPVKLRAAAADKLAALIRDNGDGWDLATGFVGTPELPSALSDHGRLDAAYTLLEQDDYPSWLYEVKMGATTTWEFWDAIREDGSFRSVTTNSMNHYAYGAVGDWMYRNIGGIAQDPAAPGYATVVFRPRPGGGIQHASTALDTVRGEVATSWRAVSGGFALDVTVPANSTGLVYVPADGPDAVAEIGQGVRVPAQSAEGVRLAGSEDGAVVYRVGSGRYRFRVGAAIPAPPKR